MRTATLLLLSVLIVSFGCEIGPRSGRGLHLPDGDVGGGELAFQTLGCTTCHDVVGGPAAPKGDRSEVIVTLGGRVSRVETHGELVTAIINPSHEISRRYPREHVAEGDVSKMENFNERMTVAQLIDLSAFLQSKYKVRREPNYLP
jgi:hypothetical protein